MWRAHMLGMLAPVFLSPAQVTPPAAAQAACVREILAMGWCLPITMTNHQLLPGLLSNQRLITESVCWPHEPTFNAQRMQQNCGGVGRGGHDNGTVGGARACCTNGHPRLCTTTPEREGYEGSDSGN